ncbi:MAG: nitrilase-related carbon-nitrogen hydrolase [Planctomycetota bacterium]|jgi:predicted amidohydrolase
MQDVKIAAAQFAPVHTDKQANLDKIAELTSQAARAGAEIVCFQEQSVTGYSLWAFGPDTRERDDNPPVVEEGMIYPAWGQPGTDPYPLAEAVPDGPSCQRLIEIARDSNVVLLAGLVELRADNSVYNTTVIVSPGGYIGKYSKTHCVPGVEYAYFKQGQSLPVYDLGKVTAGVLICYDNHHPEAHRVLAAKGAEVIFMPHVTVGRGWWHDVPADEAQQQARNWILTWLRARAFDNSVYAVFVNQGSADGEGSLGCSMILDPEGHVMARVEPTGEGFVVAELSAAQYYRIRRRTHDYMTHRRPELYHEVVRRDLAEP